MLKTQAHNVDCIVGARPNFIKIAPIMRALKRTDGVTARLIHTGQHYDPAMNAVFFDELAIPSPDINLEIGGGTGTEQIARNMLALEPLWRHAKPDLVLVVGDVNSTIAATLVAAKLSIPVAHVEAGLRSFDRAMPEEINRLVTDRLSDLLFVTEKSGIDNLRAEGMAGAHVQLVGNVMIDTLYACLPRAMPPTQTFSAFNASLEFVERALTHGFAFVTLHRPSNVDDPAMLKVLIEALVRISQDINLVFPLHPRTRTVMQAHGLAPLLARANILLTPPLGYLSALGLMQRAKLAITDSGGVQEETTALGVPCLTVRENTERPTTIEEGTNTLVGTSPDALIAAVLDVLANGGKRGRVPHLWDGKAAERIAASIAAFLAARGSVSSRVRA